MLEAPCLPDAVGVILRGGLHAHRARCCRWAQRRCVGMGVAGERRDARGVARGEVDVYFSGRGCLLSPFFVSP